GRRILTAISMLYDFDFEPKLSWGLPGIKSKGQSPKPCDE
ncbi:MAG: hypothetical protein ACI9P8_000973, partial [Bacteroidia bacterium]